MGVKWEKLEDKNEWDSFVTGAAEASIFHTWSWRSALELGGYEPVYLGYRQPETDELSAVWPLFFEKAKGIFYLLNSMPEGDVGGPLVSKNLSGLESVFTTALDSLPKSTRIVISLRSRVNVERVKDALARMGYRFSSGSGYFRVNLDSDNLGRIWNRVFAHDERRLIRYLDRQGKWTEVRACADAMPLFYELYKQTMQRQGYRLHPEGFMGNVVKAFHDDFKVLLVYSGGRPVCATSFLANRSLGTVHLTYVGYVTEKRSVSPYFFAVWKWLGWAAANGYHVANLGNGSSDPTSPNFTFKKKFGGDFHIQYTFTIPVNKTLYHFARTMRGFAQRIKST